MVVEHFWKDVLVAHCRQETGQLRNACCRQARSHQLQRHLEAAEARSMDDLEQISKLQAQLSEPGPQTLACAIETLLAWEHSGRGIRPAQRCGACRDETPITAWIATSGQAAAAAAADPVRPRLLLPRRRLGCGSSCWFAKPKTLSSWRPFEAMMRSGC